ncbi:MAG: DUF5615 family PIN-like protein [Candidatus Hydrogenedentes bacterium]|nr:DUF5615 family PIN-like protein [Candidatus Hydrogenedentota bacterium]
MPITAASYLRSTGHDADTVVDEDLGGAVVNSIYHAALEAERILVTLDLDFADIRSYRPAESRGIWVLRPYLQDRKSILALLQQAVKLTEIESWDGKLWIVEPERIRIRS